MKVHALHYANDLLARVRLFFTFLFINIFKLAQQEETTRKKCPGKINDSYSLSIKVQTTITHISICFFTTSKDFFKFRARAEKGIARNVDVSSVVGLLLKMAN